MKTKILLLAFAATVLSFGCSNDGDRGPAGAAGTVNISSHIDTISPAQWGYTVPDEYIVSINNAAITNADTATVLMYYSSVATGVWFALPGYHLPRHGENLGFMVQTGRVLVIWDALSAPPYPFYFKTVVIPATSVKPSVDTGNYEAVKKAYNLKD